MKVVIHAPSACALDRALRNLVNLRAARPGAVAELVINGEAVKHAHQIGCELPELRVCLNSLTAQGLSALGSWQVVEASVAYLAERQMAGWSYIRA